MKNKKANTAIFMAVATLINVVLMLVLLLAGFVLLARFGNPDNASANVAWTMVIFVASIGLSWVIYAAIVKAYTKKVDVEGTFAPLFGRRKPRRNPEDQNNMSVKG